MGKVSAKQYRAAFDMMPENAEKRVSNLTFMPYFVGEGHFAYRHETLRRGEKSVEYRLVCARDGTQKPLFDHEKLAKCAAKAGKAELRPEALRITPTALLPDGTVHFYTEDGADWSFDGSKLRQLRKKPPAGTALTADRARGAVVKKNDLYLVDRDDGKSTRLTHDGEAHCGYGTRSEGDTGYIRDRLAGVTVPAGVRWSPDGRRFLTYRLDERGVKPLHLLQNVPPGVDMRPVPHSYRFSMPGDAVLAKSAFFVCDPDKNRVIPTDVRDALSTVNAPISPGYSMLEWSLEGNRAVCYTISRGYKTATVYEIDPETGQTAEILSETAQTFHFFDFHKFNATSPHAQGREADRILWYSETLNTLFWLSERDGYFHIYAYDVKKRALRAQLTQGDWCVRQILHVDAGEKRLYFTASGREANTNPYHQYLYAVDLESGEIRLLSVDKGNHAVAFSPEGDFFTDTITAGDEPQTTYVCQKSGAKVAEVCRADVAALEKAGLIYPIPFTLKAADGVTDIYGALVMPAGFKPGKKYPLIDYYYGGVQTTNVPQTFFATLHAGFTQSLAQLGFCCVILDGRGTPGRGKAFHDHCYAHLGACAGMDDHEAVIRQLCEKYDFLDADRVGVWGHSGGGYAAFRCMVMKPDVYKCAVSSGGNHVQEIYLADWSERYMGAFDRALWEKQNGEHLASQLRGKLLLIHGELDDNVHPASTMRIVDALIKADKDFDMLIMPNLHHMLRHDAYFRRRVLEYFVDNLM